MTTNDWVTEDEEKDEETFEFFGKDIWDNMPVTDRVNIAQRSGLTGKLGSKTWDELTPGEKTTIMHPEERPARLEYQIKAHVALESSDGELWGVLRDTEGSYTWKPGEGPIVGTWTRSPADGLIHVFLEESIRALADKATLNLARLAEERSEKPSAPKTSRKRTPKEVVAEQEPEELAVINNLRNLIKK